MRLSFSHPWVMDDDENTPITPFTESSGVSATPKEIQDAEEEIQEEEEESSADEFTEDELMSMSMAALSRIRFIPRQEYGTPSGIEPIKTCSSCGDAGDVAIIDAEIAPHDGSDEIADEFGETPVEEGTVTEDEDLTEEMRGLRDIYDRFKMLQYPSPAFIPSIAIASEENFSDLIDSLLGILKKVMIKVAAYTRKAYIFSRDRISKSFMRLSTISKLWNIKLKMNLDNIDIERLQKFEVESFPYHVWTDTVKLALSAYELANSAERIVFDVSEDATTNQMHRFHEELKKNGIEFNITKNSIDMNDLLDKRVYSNVIDLGFSKSQINNCMRYLSDVSKCVPNAKENTLQSKIDKVIKDISNHSAKTNKAIEDGQLKKGSDEYKHAIEKIMHYTVRLDFVLTCMRCAYGLFDIVTKDILKIFGKYEDAYAFKSLVD